MNCDQAFFAEHGWLVLRGAVAHADVLRAADAFDRAIQLRGHTADDLCRGQEKTIWQLPGISIQDQSLLSHLKSGIMELVADLLFANRIQLLQDTLVLKPAQIGASIELHQDYTYTGFLDPPKSVSIRLSLTRSTMESGCMYVIDRSHLWEFQGKPSVLSDSLQRNVLEQLPSELRELVLSNCIPVELACGDISIHHCLTYHGSYENLSDSVQKTIVTHVFDGDCRLITNRIPHEAIRFFRTNHEGRLNLDSFPLLFQRQRPEKS